MVGKGAPLAPPSIYDAYPLTQRSLAPPPPLVRARSQHHLRGGDGDGADAMAERRLRELFERARADDDDGLYSDDYDAHEYDNQNNNQTLHHTTANAGGMAERRSATMCSRFGKFTGEVYETKERSRMINVLKRRSRNGGAAAPGGGGGGGGADASAASKFTADDVLRAGMLTKQGSWRRNWKTRFFLLRRDFPSLSYYKSEEKLELLGAVPITHDSLVLDKSAPGGHAPFRFQLRTDALGAALLLETETRDNQQRWMDACRALVDALRADKFRQSKSEVDRDPTTAPPPSRATMAAASSSSASRTRPSLGARSSASAATMMMLSSSAPQGSGGASRIRASNQLSTTQHSHRDLRRAADLRALDASDSSSDDEDGGDNQKDGHDDDDDDELWATGRNHFLVVLDESTKQQNLEQIQQTRTRRLSTGPPLAAPIRDASDAHAPTFDLVLELALGRSSKLLTRSESVSGGDKLRCCVKVVGYASASKRAVELGTTDSVKVAASASTNPDGSASPVRVAFSVVLRADLARFDQLRFTVYRASSSASSSRATVGIGRCFVDDAFKTLGAPRLVALAEKSSSFPDMLGAAAKNADAEPSLLSLHRKAVASASGSSHNLLPLDSNAIHLVVQAFPSLAPQHVLPTSGVDMAATKYLLPTTLSSDPAAATSPRDGATTTPSNNNATHNGRLMDNGSFLTTSSESVAPPNARHIVVDEILRAPRATFALPLAFLDFLEETALERTRVLQKQVEADGDKETAAMLAFELEFYRKKLEEYLRQRQFLMKQEKRLLQEAKDHRIFQHAAEQVLLAATQKKKASKHAHDESGADATGSTSGDLVAPFKRSTYKSLDLWQFVPTNMQDQFLCAHQPPHMAASSSSSADAPPSDALPFVWHTMTMGCPAAHSKGFASGGFPLTASVQDAVRASFNPSMSASAYSASAYSDDDVENELFAKDRTSLQPMDVLRRRSRASLSATRSSHLSSSSHNPALDAGDSVGALKRRLELKERLDIVASQALTAAVACLTASLDLAAAGSDAHRQQLALAARLGFLVHFESLLSTQGKEVGMLEDFAAAAKWLRNVFVQFRRHNPTGDAASPYFAIKHYSPPERRGVGGSGDVSAPPTHVLVTMGVTDAQLAVLPALLAAGAPLRVRCVLFSQGVNEKQSLVHALKSQTVKVQERINRESLEELKEIYGAFRRAHGGDAAARYADRRAQQLASPSRYALETLDDLLTQIEQHVCESASQFKKNVALLTDTSDFCRELGSARVTCCKSGKDRTAMSVTLEQTRLCCARLKVAGAQGKPLCATMRLAGVRRPNVFLNTASAKFAFNEMQRKMLPECYKPPQGTYKSGTT